MFRLYTVNDNSTPLPIVCEHAWDGQSIIYGGELLSIVRTATILNSDEKAEHSSSDEAELYSKVESAAITLYEWSALSGSIEQALKTSPAQPQEAQQKQARPVASLEFDEMPRIFWSDAHELRSRKHSAAWCCVVSESDAVVYRYAHGKLHLRYSFYAEGLQSVVVRGDVTFFASEEGIKCVCCLPEKDSEIFTLASRTDSLMTAASERFVRRRLSSFGPVALLGIYDKVLTLQFFITKFSSLIRKNDKWKNTKYLFICLFTISI